MRVIHPNSATARQTVNFTAREREVMAVLRDRGPLTDREVMETLGQRDPNHVRPAITNMVQDGRLVEVGRVKCRVTGRPVRRVWFADHIGDTTEKVGRASGASSPVPETGGLFPPAANVGTVWRGR